jgi:hypothetical protein
MKVTEAWSSASTGRKWWLIFWFSFLVLASLTGSKLSIVATGVNFLMHCAWLLREAKDKRPGDG